MTRTKGQSTLIFHAWLQSDVRIDDVDWKLIRVLYSWEYGNYPAGPLRISLGELSEKVGLHPKTVKLRLQALRKGGVIDGPYFEPRPYTMGLYRSAYGFEGLSPSAADEIGLILRSFPSVETVVFGTGFAYVIVWHDEPKSPPGVVAEISEALHTSEAWKSFSSVDFTPGSRTIPRLHPIDWSLVLALRRPPAGSMSSVARKLRITSRQAERRARRLIEMEAGAMVTRFLISKVEGWIYVHYVAVDGDSRAINSLAEAFPDRVVGPFSQNIRPNVGVAVANLNEAERRRRAAEGMPGIKKLDLKLVRDWIYPKYFEPWLEGHVEKWQSDFRQGEILTRH